MYCKTNLSETIDSIIMYLDDNEVRQIDCDKYQMQRVELSLLAPDKHQSEEFVSIKNKILIIFTTTTIITTITIMIIIITTATIILTIGLLIKIIIIIAIIIIMTIVMIIILIILTIA